MTTGLVALGEDTSKSMPPFLQDVEYLETMAHRKVLARGGPLIGDTMTSDVS